MFDATLKDREQSFDSAPGTTMFLHWLVGMVYVFYFASFILLLREVKQQPFRSLWLMGLKKVDQIVFVCSRCSDLVFCGS